MSKRKMYQGSPYCQYCYLHKDFAAYIDKCKKECPGYCGESIDDLADEYENCKKLVDDDCVGTYELQAFVEYILPPDKVTGNYGEDFYSLSNKIEGLEHSIADYLENPDGFVYDFNADLCFKFDDCWMENLLNKKISADKISLLFGVSNTFVTVFLKDLFDKLFVISDDNSLFYDIEEKN